jgi:phage baseplate assembly protein gpV
MIQQGQTSERDIKTATARVAMDDLGGMVSGKMQVLFPAIGGWNMFFTPKEGDHVVTSRLPNGQEEGYILGKVYTGNKMPQGGAPNIILLVSDNGKNVIRFDADKGTLDLVVDQDATAKFFNLDVEVKETISVKAKNAEINVEENIKEEAGKNITSNAGAKNTVKGADVEINGAVVVTGGTLECNGTAPPTGTGCWCAKPFCIVDGSPHIGNKANGT